MHEKPTIAFLSAGGTITSIRTAGAAGILPTLTAQDLLDTVPQAAEVAEIIAVQVSHQFSASFSYAELLRMIALARQHVADGAQGVVISQGTDSIEETSYFFDLLWDEEAPLVVTGAMRNPSQPGGEGPANLLASIQTAASPNTRGLGVLVVLNEQIQAARFVRKSHTFAASTFTSPVAGPLGWVVEGTPILHTSVPRFPALEPATELPPVALVKSVLDDDGRLLRALLTLDYSGVVVEGMGGGHVPRSVVPAITELAAAMPVVLCSRTGAGEVLRHTYAFSGGEIELIREGVIPAGALDGLKARLLLAVLLSCGANRAEIAAEFSVRGYLAN
ncbi:MAG: asparaginase [Propionibacteriaceae bacterium]|jgi:L-asparaginase|nr:asparaginase [Propionibacteriaceae bacterium]